MQQVLSAQLRGPHSTPLLSTHLWVTVCTLITCDTYSAAGSGAADTWAPGLLLTDCSMPVSGVWCPHCTLVVTQYNSTRDSQLLQNCPAQAAQSGPVPAAQHQHSLPGPKWLRRWIQTQCDAVDINKMVSIIDMKTFLNINTDNYINFLQTAR